MSNRTPPFAVQRIDHIVFRVVDLERSVVFYKEALGCRVVKRRDELGLVHLRAGASLIDLISVQGCLGLGGGPAAGSGARNVDHLCLRIDPFDEPKIIAHLAAHGAQTTAPAEDNFGAEGGGLSLYFHDPDGNLLELKGPASQV